jgi:hypothetical protein
MEQFGFEGLAFSIIVGLIGLLFISIVVASQKLKSRYSARLWGIVGLLMIFYLKGTLEGLYEYKSWYEPSLFPPDDFSYGSLAADQGHSI